MKNINYMCVDPSKSCTGVYINANKKSLLTNIKNREKCTEQEAYKNIFDAISELIFVHKVDLIIYESYAFSKFGKSRSPSVLAEIIGVVKSAAYLSKNEIVLLSISSSLWKGVLRGMPFINCKKDKKYIKLAETYYSRQFATCDEVDAFSIAVAIETLYKKHGFSDAQIKMKTLLTNIVDKIEKSKTVF